MRSLKCLFICLTFILIAAACDDLRDAPQTPTPATLFPTQEIALFTETPTRTPSATITASRTPSNTPTPTDTSTPSHTPSATATASSSSTATRTPTFTRTPSPTQTSTSTNTFTPSPSPSDTRTPTTTSSPTLSRTLPPTATPTPTRTASFTPSRTPTPTITPSPSITPESFGFGLAPSDTPIPQFEIEQGETPVSVDETSKVEGEDNGGVGVIGGTPIPFATLTPLPTFAPVQITSTSVLEVAVNADGSLATDSRVGVISDDRAVIVLEDSRQVQVIRPYAFSPGGAAASFEADNQFYVNGSPLTISPSSAFGLPPHMRILDMEWTSDGRYLAFVLEGNQQATDQTGVWVLDTSTNTSQQIMRNDDRHATRIDWSPDGSVVLIHMTTPAGGAITFLPRDHTANNGFRMHPYADATWAIDGRSVVVSGRQHSGGYILGRILLDFEQSFIPYSFEGETHAATETANGRIVFVGGGDGVLRLYSLTGNTLPTAISGEIRGDVIAWEWGSNGLLLTTQTEFGRRVWVITRGGGITDVTPLNGAPLATYWR